MQLTQIYTFEGAHAEGTNLRFSFKPDEVNNAYGTRYSSTVLSRLVIAHTFNNIVEEYIKVTRNETT